MMETQKKSMTVILNTQTLIHTCFCPLPPHSRKPKNNQLTCRVQRRSSNHDWSQRSRRKAFEAILSVLTNISSCCGQRKKSPSRSSPTPTNEFASRHVEAPPIPTSFRSPKRGLVHTRGPSIRKTIFCEKKTTLFHFFILP